jgi:pyruvyl transferase EpsO
MSELIGSKALIADLQSKIDAVVRPLIPEGPVSLVDFPNYANVGDSAIWLGQIEFLRQRLGVTPSYGATIDSYSRDALLASATDGPILINGGGNFGTIWPRHHDFILRLLRDHPGRPIVLLPQSLHFDPPEAADEVARAMEQHGRFTMVVRDQKSLAFARQKFPCDVHLAPDMAFFIGATQPRRPKDNFLFLMRSDKEKVEGQEMPSIPEGGDVTDWLEESRRRLRISRWMGRLSGIMRGGNGKISAYNALALNRYWRGVEILSRGRVVITDRLHAHIMSTLLDIPHVALDNSYGKVGGFIEAWTKPYAGLRRATTMDEALAAGRTLLATMPQCAAR